jgi:hypothetical protein
MAKLLQFRTPDDSRRSGRQSSAVEAGFDLPAHISRIGTFRAGAKEDIRQMILMFDVALMHGRLVIQSMDDPETRRRLEAHLGAIEEMLDLARVKAANL